MLLEVGDQPVEEPPLGIRRRPGAELGLVDVEGERLVLEEQEDERCGEHHAQQPGAAEPRERDPDRHPSPVLDKAHDGVRGGAADHQRRGLRHADVDVSRDGNTEGQHRQESPGAQHELDEQE